RPAVRGALAPRAAPRAGGPRDPRRVPRRAPRHRVPLRSIPLAPRAGARAKLRSTDRGVGNPPRFAYPAPTVRRGAKMAAHERSSPQPSARAAAKASGASRAAGQRAGKAASRGATMSGEGAVAEESEIPIAELGDDLVSGKKALVTSAARVIDALLEREPEAVVPIIDRFVKAVGGDDKRAAQTAAAALPIMARVAPARVARHLPRRSEG